MKAQTYTLHKEHCDLYAEIHGSFTVTSCQIKLAQKDIILLSKVSNSYILTSRRALIQLTILIQKSRKQSHNKDRTGNHLKIKT